MKWNDQSQSVCIDVLGRMVEPGRILEKVLSRKYNLFDLHVWKVAPLTGIPSVYWDVQSNGPTDRRPISFTGGSPLQSFENTFYTLDKFFWLFWQIYLAILTNTNWHFWHNIFWFQTWKSCQPILLKPDWQFLSGGKFPLISPIPKSLTLRFGKEWYDGTFLLLSYYIFFLETNENHILWIYF